MSKFISQHKMKKKRRKESTMNFYTECDFEDRATKIKIVAPLAMAYVPMQKFTNLYSAEEGLSRGTIFKDLDLPFKGGSCK